MECNPIHSIKAVDPWCDSHRRSVIICIREINLQNDVMRKRLEEIVRSRDTTRMTGEQILMGYNAHKDLARAGLSESQYPEKQNDEACICAAKADPRDLVVCPIHG